MDSSSDYNSDLCLRMLFSLPDLPDDTDTDRQTASFSGETATDQNATDAEDTNDHHRRHTIVFPFFQQPPSSSTSEPSDLHSLPASALSSAGEEHTIIIKKNDSIGFISDILDGVVFAPVGSSELPRPSPDTRARTTLSSFKAPVDAVAANSTESLITTVPQEAVIPTPTVRAIKPLPQPDLETLFQQELAAKIKQRSLQQQKQHQDQQLGRIRKPTSPPIPQPQNNNKTEEYENPLYQTLTECLTGPSSVTAIEPEEEEEATYADIDHLHQIESSKVYANTVEVNELDAIYENVEEFQPEPTYSCVFQDQEVQDNQVEEEQTYVNIIQTPSQEEGESSQVLTALILDVDSATSTTSTTNNRSSFSSDFSGNSSSSPISSSGSPVQLSPTESLANVSIGSTRSSHSPDSGVFGLLKPAEDRNNNPSITTLVIEIKGTVEEEPSLDQTLKQFEQLEELSSTLVANNKMEEPLEKIPINVLLDMAGPVQPSEENGTEIDETVPEAPRMPISPPPQVMPRSRAIPIVDYQPEEEDLYSASLATVDSLASSSSLGDANNNERSISSPEPRPNLGAKIVEDQVRKQQKKDLIRSKNLDLDPNVGESFDKLELKRQDLIDEMTPKRKNMANNWVQSPNSEGPSTSGDMDHDTHLLEIPLDGSKKASTGGVNSDSILVRKEETKAFWEGKMQPLEPEEEQPQVYTNNKNQWNGKVERALSPPPGFIDSTDGVEHHEEEPSLSADDYAPVGSITFKGNDVPISDPDRKQQYIFGQQEEVEEEYEEPVVIQTERSVPPPSRPAPRGEYFEPASASSINPTETLIEREIRLQKEREEAVLRERQMALEALEVARKQQQKPSAPVKNKEAPMCFKPAQPPVSLEPVVTASKPVKKLSVPSSASESVISPAEIRISEEIRELKRREEELRRLRESNARNEDGTMPSFATSGVTDDEGLFSDADRDVTSSSGGSEAASSRVESPEAGQMVSDYPSSKFPHQRTQSMDSMSSGHSSGDHGPTTTGVDPSTLAVKRGARNSHKTVMPLEDPSEQDDTPAYLRVSKETPIEREIRLGREREEALRREKGLQQPNWTSSNGSTVSGPKEIRQQDGQRITNGTNGDKRDVQHRLASSIIQKEMNETAERESELKNDGRIITTSVERVDSKVATLADYKKNTAPYQRQGSRIKTQISVDSDAPKEAEVGARPQPPKNTYSRPAATAVPPTVVSAPPATWRNFSNQQPNSQRGLMEKFLKTRGQMGTPTTFVNGSSGSPAGDLAASSMMMKPSAAPPVPRYVPPVAKPPIQLITASEAQRNEDGANEEEKPVPSRRHYATTEEKIQQEFREMQKREEELKLNRSKMFKSQPNLLACLDGDEDGSNEPEPSMRSAHSNADLLADEPASMEREGGATVKAGARRKSALIAQWESRIQQDF